MGFPQKNSATVLLTLLGLGSILGVNGIRLFGAMEEREEDYRRAMLPRQFAQCSSGSKACGPFGCLPNRRCCNAGAACEFEFNLTPFNVGSSDNLHNILLIIVFGFYARGLFGWKCVLHCRRCCRLLLVCFVLYCFTCTLLVWTNMSNMQGLSFQDYNVNANDRKKVL